MSWSGLKKQVKQFICPELAGRIDFHITSYRRDSSVIEMQSSLPGPSLPGRGWVTVDGVEILNLASVGRLVEDRDDLPTQTGVTNRQDLYEAIKQYAQLSIEEALDHDSFIIQGLAVVDRRLGKKRLAKIEKDKLHPFVHTLYGLRCEITTARK